MLIVQILCYILFTSLLVFALYERNEWVWHIRKFLKSQRKLRWGPQCRWMLIKGDTETTPSFSCVSYPFGEQTRLAINIRYERSSKRKHTLCSYTRYGHGQRALRTVYAACNRAGELFEPRVVGSNQGKWLGKCERSVWAVVQPNWVWASIEIDCRKSSLFFCLFYVCMVYIVAYKSVL